MPIKSTCFSHAELLTGEWVASLGAFKGVTLLKRHDHYFDCDFNGSHTSFVVLPTDKSWCLTLVLSNCTYKFIHSALQFLEQASVRLLGIQTLNFSPAAIVVYFESDLALNDNEWQKWLAFAQAEQADIGLRSFFKVQEKCRLACFDMDSTLIQAEVIDELAAEAGLLAEVSAITERAMQGELNFQESFQHRLQMLKGLPEIAVQAVLDRIKLMDGAEQLFAFLDKQSMYTVILSGGFDVFARYVQQRLGIHEVHANTLEFVNGQLSGRVVAPIMDAERKQATLVDLAHQQSVPMAQTLAVGDGANDLLMLGQAGLGIAFRAKPKVQASARIVIRFGTLAWAPFFLGYSQTELEALSLN